MVLRALKFLCCWMVLLCSAFEAWPIAAQSDSDASLPQRDAEAIRKDRLKVEVLMRLSNMDVNRDEKLLATVHRYLDFLGDDPQQLRIIRQLKPNGVGGRLLELAATWEEQKKTSEALQAIELALSLGYVDELKRKFTAEEPTEEDRRLARVLSLSDSREAFGIAESLIEEAGIDAEIRQAAAIGLSKFPAGQKRLIALAEDDQLTSDVRFLVSAALRTSALDEVREKAAILFPPKKTSTVELPPIDELCRKQGDPERGRLLFEGVAKCSQCHTVKGTGKNVGPDLTEIGSKLSREAMYLAILEPSAGISHNYESYAALLDTGAVIVGLLVSKTEQHIVLKDAEGIERTLDADAIEDLKKLEKSLMPDNLQETMSVDGLIDVVEYLMSLQRERP